MILQPKVAAPHFEAELVVEDGQPLAQPWLDKRPMLDQLIRSSLL